MDEELENLEKLLDYKGNLRLRVPYIEDYQDKDNQNWVVSELLKIGFSEHQIECFNYVKIEDYSMFDFIDGGITDFDDVEPISPPRRNGNTLSGYIMGISSENSSIQNRSISDDSDGWDSLKLWSDNSINK